MGRFNFRTHAYTNIAITFIATDIRNNSITDSSIFKAIETSWGHIYTRPDNLP